MTAFLQIVSALKEQMHATLSRSDVLRPLAWLIGLLLTGVVAVAIGKAPEWLLVLLASLLVGCILLYGVAYVYCLMLKDPDLLRSEKYSLQKMAIEHGLIGDNHVGLFEENDKVEKPSTAQITKPSGRTKS